MREELERLRDDFLLRDGAPVVWLDDVPGRGLGACSIAIGAFDGFHIGHARLIAEAVDDARSRGVSCVAVTFDPDPDCVVGPGPSSSCSVRPGACGRLPLLGSMRCSSFPSRLNSPRSTTPHSSSACSLRP